MTQNYSDVNRCWKMKSTIAIAILIVVFNLAVSAIGKDDKGWSAEEKDRGDIFSNCANQSPHKVKLSVYSDEQCLVFTPT